MGCGGTAPRSGHFTFGEIFAGTHLTWVTSGSHRRSGRFGENKSHGPCKEPKPDSLPSSSWSLYWLRYPEVSTFQCISLIIHDINVSTEVEDLDRSPLHYDIMYLSYVVTNQTARRHNHEQYKLMFTAVKFPDITKALDKLVDILSHSFQTTIKFMYFAYLISYKDRQCTYTSNRDTFSKPLLL